MRRILGKILLIVSIIIMNFTTCFAYSDNLFEFDLPEEYKMIKKEGRYEFHNTKNNYRSIIIDVIANDNEKTRIWDLKESKFNEFKDEIAAQAQILQINKKAKLGKEKAIQMTARTKDNSTYWDIYILSSNKYYYQVYFIGNSKQALNNNDYQKIKDSFNLKDFSMDYRVKVVGITALLIFVQHKRKKKEEYLNSITQIDNDITHL